ncbi:UDP-2,4-diacetamido-2,4,6-trideoxy-beta-L-altropyranose hydrolase [Candidatus Magnetomonas plexicatena]|uniref:UDP-2,4-diacetamido-2,4, 6-trideoxy-beta-L-altropyranose hydrolase n=1 Tax=Candidatus Magnetomonas plexicatena TaxID=2552947 RepID=UPI001C747F43|nr:UDP-2,4-diacetamido-2,4,6-trideoxy-beta-L-altropyranose hydrolase [Nitrospirales bacterium LBB_01]
MTVFRADSSKETGTGHVMRCLALAEALKDLGTEIVFITYCQSDALIERLEDSGFRVYRLKSCYPDSESIEESIGYLNQFKDCWVVCDGLLFDHKYYEIIKTLGFKLLVIDDMAREPFYNADIVLNQNLHGLDLTYNCAPGTRLLLGNEFVILRREFLKYIGIKKKFNSELTRILVTLGGMDSNNYTEKILLTIKDMLSANQVKEALELTVVTGGGNRYADRIRAIDMPVPTTHLHNAANMPELMHTHDIAITSGGTTVWELAFMGVPSIVGRTAPIEDYLVNGLSKNGLFVDAGWYETLDEGHFIRTLLTLIHDKELQKEMSVKAQSLIDGRAIDKLVHQMIL